MITLNIEQIGDSPGCVLPERILNGLSLRVGDKLEAVEIPGGYAIRRIDPEVVRQVKMGLEFMEEYRETFKRLAR